MFSWTLLLSGGPGVRRPAPLEGVRAEGSDLFRKSRHQLGEPRRFRRRHPFDGEPFGIDADAFQSDADGMTSGQGFVITIQVMTFAQVSAHDEDAVGAFE